MSMNSQNINDMIKNNINRESAYGDQQPKTHYVKNINRYQDLAESNKDADLRQTFQPQLTAF